ncbi:hypothetical protein ES288_A11G201200v1 [Gossypium darwinii]|uniref:MADS-box domain-containing protein n=1 Tax=Gossypium darwinii TaxID=34276 RepID=A0A5D2ENE0_GOSDA|nr:hypothetical protein ES288_A11G201200v1 [Gossypium darwinii]
MARRKLKMKLIEKEKARAATLKKRLQSLKKKAHEFSTLCDVEACMIVFEPELKDSPSGVEVWPSDPVQVETIIGRYNTMATSGSQKKTFSISNFFDMCRRQARDEVAQVCKANFKAKFPTWDDRIDNFSPEHIASCLTKLDSNIEVVKRKIMLMKGDDEQKLLRSESRTLGGFGARSTLSSSDNYIPAAALHLWNRNLLDNNIQTHTPLEIVNHFDHIQDIPRKNSEFGVIRDQPPLPTRPLDMQLPSFSPADEALVKLSLSLNPIEKSLRMSMMNDLGFGVRSGIASSSKNSFPNNAMYNPPPSYSICHDPRFGMPSNDVMFDSASIPVLHDPRSNGMQNNVMLKEPKSASETCFYAPSMRPEVATYNQQQLMMPHVFSQMPPPGFTDFYHDINQHEMINKKQRF